jgi:hypothetical protein
MVRRLAPLWPWIVLAGLCLPGCYDVLTHQDAETVWMEWTGTVEVSPTSLELTAAPGEQATAELVFRETSGKAGAEMALTLEGDAASQLAFRPGEFTVAVTPDGALTVVVTYTAAAGAGTAELVVTSSGTPAEIRIPIAVSAS